MKRLWWNVKKIYKWKEKENIHKKQRDEVKKIVLKAKQVSWDKCGKLIERNSQENKKCSIRYNIKEFREHTKIHISQIKGW